MKQVLATIAILKVSESWRNSILEEISHNLFVFYLTSGFKKTKLMIIHVFRSFLLFSVCVVASGFCSTTHQDVKQFAGPVFGGNEGCEWDVRIFTASSKRL